MVCMDTITTIHAIAQSYGFYGQVSVSVLLFVLCMCFGDHLVQAISLLSGADPGGGGGGGGGGLWGPLHI